MLPDPSKITLVHIKQLVERYPQGLRSIYEQRIKSKASDKKKAAERFIRAIEDDAWRYDELPAKLKELEGTREGKRDDDDEEKELCLDSDELVRLVQWKITHGASRPFLLSHIRKNASSTIRTTTSSAFTQLPANPQSQSQAQSRDSVLSALKTLTQLSGVGPATASLILSVYRPDTIPFFQDELFVWLCRYEELKQKGDVKGVGIKYNVKEYEELSDKVHALRERLRTEGDGEVECWELEKAAFVGFHEESQSGEQIENKEVGRKEILNEKRKRMGDDKVDVEQGEGKVSSKRATRRNKG